MSTPNEVFATLSEVFSGGSAFSTYSSKIQKLVLVSIIGNPTFRY